MSRGILAAGHRLLRIVFILLFQLPSKSQSDNRSSACSATHPSLFRRPRFFDRGRFIFALSLCDGTNITMIANNRPPLNETSYSRVHKFPDCWKSGLSHWDGLDQTGWRLRSCAEAGGRGSRRRRWGEVKMSHSLAWSIFQRVEDTDRAADQTPLRINVIFQSMFLKRGRRART